VLIYSEISNLLYFTCLILGVKNNLHVVMILDSESEFFNKCLENSPAVLDHSHILWLNRWDDKTMEIIPELIFKKLLLKPYNKFHYLLFNSKFQK